jgi:hypothetical protein
MYRTLMAVLASLCLAQPALAQADPCNFAALEGQPVQALGWQQVMDCYRSVPLRRDDLDATVAFVKAARERSDLNNLLDQRYGWRAALDAFPARADADEFPDDLSFQLAMVREHKALKNPHWRYRRPVCYTDLMVALMPFDFGSAVIAPRGGKRQQIVFIESAAYQPELYRAFTGVDAQAYVGARVVSINDVPVLEAFRTFARESFSFDDNDGQGLNRILQNASYSMRVLPAHDLPPDRLADVYQLETRDGRTMRVTMPWIFVPPGLMGLPQIDLSTISNTADFRALCYRPSPVVAGGASSLNTRLNYTEDLSFEREFIAKRQAIQRMERDYRGPRADYFEAPPGQSERQLTTLIAKNQSMSAFQLRERATVIRLNDFVGDWREQVTEATQYACRNSDHLIVDMRSNAGGFASRLSWLAGHLAPGRTGYGAYDFIGRMPLGNTGLNELIARVSEYYAGESCSSFLSYACYFDAVTGEPLDAQGWSDGSVTEQRGGVSQTLTRRLFFFKSSDASAEPIACPGRFRGRTLIILSNGSGGSAGYFWPTIMRSDATIVTAGGFLGEPMVTGVARGASVWGMRDYESDWEQYLIAEEGWTPTDPLPLLTREVESFIERPGYFVPGTDNLTLDDTRPGDTHIDVWSDSPRTDGFVYRQALRAVKAMRGVSK